MTTDTGPGSTAPAPQATSQPLADLAASVHQARPEWGTRGILAVLEDLTAEGTEFRTLREAALEAARTKRYKAPIGIRWRLEDEAVGQAPADDRAPCAICGKPRARCEYDRPLVTKAEDYDDHVYEPVPARRGHRTSSN